MLWGKNLLFLSAVALACSASDFLDEEWKIWKTKYEYTPQGTLFKKKRLAAGKRISPLEMPSANTREGAEVTPQFDRKPFNQSRGFLGSVTRKQYKNKKVEAFRRQVWEETWRRVHKHNELANQGLKKYTLTANHFADMVAVIETRYCLKHNELISFSEQQLLDCDSGNEACCGGEPEQVFEHVGYKGLMQSKDYEYTGTAFTCLYDPEDAVKINITKFYSLRGVGNVAKVLAMDGPVAAMLAIGEDFVFYNGGIYADAEGCSPTIRHTVAVIGYGSECGEDYWIIKNSWGNEWGEKGYARLNRRGNECVRVLSMATGEIADPE